MRQIAVSVLAFSAIVGTTAAMAADLPPAAPPPPRAPAAYIPAPPPFSWTGFYVGINGGWGWNQWSNPDGQFAAAGFSNTENGNGPLAGGQIGFNYQISQFVVGVDADFDWANIKWSQSIAIPIGGLFGGPGASIGSTLSDKDQFLSTFGARFGYAFDHALFYAKAGGAWTREQFNLSVTNIVGAVASGSVNDNRLGWMVGGGLEYAVTDNITVKAEYNYVSFGSENQTLTISGGGLAGATGTFSTKQNISLVKVGLSYLFNSF